MTNEEAIKELEEVKPTLDNVFAFSANRKAEAIDQAIKILKCVDTPFIRANIPLKAEDLNRLKKLIEDQMKYSKAVLLPDYCELLTPFAIPNGRPQGHWIYIQRPSGSKYKCNLCEHYVQIGTDRNYCPNCGADMLEGGVV